jgi:hypothetical protein
MQYLNSIYYATPSGRFYTALDRASLFIALMEKISIKWTEPVTTGNSTPAQLELVSKGYVERLMTFYQAFCMPDPAQLSQTPFASNFQMFEVNL